MQKIDFTQLLQMAQASAAVTVACSCNKVALAAWQRLPTSLELDRFEEVGSLMDDPYDEPTFAEYPPPRHALRQRGRAHRAALLSL